MVIEYPTLLKGYGHLIVTGIYSSSLNCGLNFEHIKRGLQIHFAETKSLEFVAHDNTPEHKAAP